MELNYVSVNLTVILVVNILFLVPGVCLNSLVILSFRRNNQLHKKLCYFTIMVLSCFDLLSLCLNHSFVAFLALHWLITGKIAVKDWESHLLFLLSGILLGFPLIALLVLNFDRYLATYYPLFHRTSVTKGKLLIPLAVFCLGFTIGSVISEYKIVITYPVFLAICCVIFLLSMTFFNYKLFIIARKNRRNKKGSPQTKRTFSLKKISSCLLCTPCFILLSIPPLVYIWLAIRTSGHEASDKQYLAGLWGRTMPSINGTCNCLIFYWKNKVLRTDGLKVIKNIKVCRR